MGKQIVVLGMHRSATSLVAKGLHDAGVHMGDSLMGPGPGNPHGHYEDNEFFHLNEAILNEHGTCWERPIAIDTTEHENKINQLVNKDKELWGWKDPRTTLTIRTYYDKLEDPIIVACFRKPEKVGKSLEARGNMSAEEGEKVAKEYNRILIDFLKEKFL